MMAARAAALLGVIGSVACTPQIRPEVRWIALGDSITGTLDSPTYPQRLVEALGVAPEAFAAEGRGGRTAAEGRERLLEILEFGIYPNAEVLIYFLGGAEVIDFVASRDPGLAVAPSEPEYPFTSELQVLLAEIHAAMSSTLEIAVADGLEVIVATYYPLPSGVTPCPALRGNVLDDLEAARANEYIASLNDIIRDLAAEWGAAVVDFHQGGMGVLQEPAHFADCLHPSPAGADILAGRFADILAD